MSYIPSPSLKMLARYALCVDPGVPNDATKKAEFRERASKPEKAIVEIANEIAGHGAGKLVALEADEAGFVVGWLYAIEKDLTDHNGKFNDEMLLAHIRKRVACSDPLDYGTMSG